MDLSLKIILGVSSAITFYYGCKMAKQCYSIYQVFKNINHQDQAHIFDNYIEIPYKHMNINYKVWLPYNHKLVLKMLPYTVTAVKDNQSLNITQQPGVPYLITPYDLNAESIITYNENEDQEDFYYNQIMPFYLKCD